MKVVWWKSRRLSSQSKRRHRQRNMMAMLCMLKCDDEVRAKICRGTYVAIKKLVTKSYKIIFKRMKTSSLNASISDDTMSCATMNLCSEQTVLRLSLLRRQSDHTEGEVPVDCCQLQVGVHTAPSHWYSLWPGLSCCSVLHWELRIEWQQGMYVRNKQWLRPSLLRRQSDHTEGEVPVDCC